MPLPSQRILVIDNEPLVCDSIRRLLELDGHIVETALTSREAMALFELKKYALLLVDYRMPDTNGDKLAAEIKAIAPEQKILMITAYPEALVTSRVSLAGIEGLLGKPFDLHELRDALKKAMSG